MPIGVVPKLVPPGEITVVGGVCFNPGNPGGGGIMTDSGPATVAGFDCFTGWFISLVFVSSWIGLKPGAKDVAGIPKLGASEVEPMGTFGCSGAEMV